MQESISDLTDKIESLETVTSVGAYPADYDLAKPDIIEVTGGDPDTVMSLIRDVLDDGDTCLQMANGSYLLYRSLGVIDEHDGSKFDILAYSGNRIEAVLVEAGSSESASVGDVHRFNTDETDYDITLYDAKS